MVEPATTSPAKYDLPFYNGSPVAFTLQQWLALIALTCIAITILLAPIGWFRGALAQFIPAILFPLLPLLGIYCFAGNLGMLFRSVTRRGVATMFGYAFANLGITLLVGTLLARQVPVSPNAGIELLLEMPTNEIALFYIRTLPQLIGEEVFTIVPLLAIMTLCYQHFGWSRRSSLIVAWVATAILFAVIHLPAYNWQLLQCILVIGTARLVLSLAYLRTGNLWVSCGAHIINDWVLFSLALLVGSQV